MSTDDRVVLPLLTELLDLLKPLMDPEYCSAFPSAWELCPFVDATTGSGERLDGEEIHQRIKAAYDRLTADSQPRRSG